MIAARIDQLSRSARTLVRRAAIFPRGRFDEDELAIVATPDSDTLAEAEDEELLLRDPSSPGVWAFRSDVLRDVAYESLAKRERQRLHLLVADALSVPETAERYPRAIAFHLEQAARAAADLDPRERAIAERAVDALALAGDIARRRIESRAAADLYTRALALAGPEDRWDGREAWIVSMLGEARYWLGDFDEAESRFRKALGLADHDDRVAAHAARFLADITMTIRGDDHLAAALFDRSIDAARRLGDPRVLARSLLMAAWVPFWQGRLGDADAMFREALEVSRSGEGTDRWAEVRALVGIANVTSLTADEADALALGREALSVGEAANQPFSVAIAHQVVGTSLRRRLDLDPALEHADASVLGLRELGARWELASALADRGTIHRLRQEPEEAETDLREALVLCRELHDRALVGPAAAELARVLVLRGDVAGARTMLADPQTRTGDEQPWAARALLIAEAATSLTEGDREAARGSSLAALQRSSVEPVADNPYVAAVWWTGSLFGAAIVGGEETLAAARETLERNGWRQALLEPELVGSTG